MCELGDLIETYGISLIDYATYDENIGAYEFRWFASRIFKYKGKNISASAMRGSPLEACRAVKESMDRHPGWKNLRTYKYVELPFPEENFWLSAWMKVK